MVQGAISPGSEITAITHFGAPVPVAGAPAYRAGSKRLAQGVQCGPDVGSSQNNAPRRFVAVLQSTV